MDNATLPVNLLEDRLIDISFPDLSVRTRVRSSPGAGLLADSTIYIWSVDLREFHGYLTHCETILSKDERERADRFRFSADRERYILCRGILRSLLSHYLACLPTELEFSYTKMGKPELIGTVQGGPLHFNISHSVHRGLFGITRDCPIGVDVEHFVPMDFLGIAKSFFSPQEADSLMTLPSDRQMERFFALWTCKEALMKATGDGLNDDLQSLEVLFTGEDDPRCSYAPGGQQAQDWQIRVVHPAPDYVGAVAFGQRDLNLVTRRLRGSL